MIVQNISEDNSKLILPLRYIGMNLSRTQEVLRIVAAEVGAKEVVGDDGIAKISIVGVWNAILMAGVCGFQMFQKLLLMSPINNPDDIDFRN